MSVYSVNVYPSSTTIKTGNWYYGAYAIVNASSNCCTDVEWYSDSPSVASVNKSYGYIYGISPGTAKIYAISTVDSSKKDYITVKVTSGTICVDSVTLNRSSVSLEKGDKLTLSATVCPTNASNKSISWSSTNPSVATVSGGVVTAKARGWTYIFAEAQDGSGEYDSCYVNVTEDILVTSVTVSPSSKTMNIGDSTYLYETVCPTNATNKCVKWSSNRTSVATVNPDTGLVIAQGTGTATINATAQDGSNKKGYCTITVNPPVAVTGVEVCPTSLTMNVGDIEYLCASITPSNATNQTLTWCSSNENVATVGLYTGKVTAKKAGATTITATTADGGYQDCMTITVNYCGGSNYRDVTKHNMVLHNDGYYVCTRCGYRVKSPELEDQQILSNEDYLKVFSCLMFYSYIEALKRSAPQNPNLPITQNTVLQLATEIRQKSVYKNRYDYSDSNGKCVGPDINYNSGNSTIYFSEVTFLNIGNYNGLTNSIHDLVMGIFCPEVSLVQDIIELLTHQMNAIDFSALVADVFDYSNISTGLSIASAIIEATDINVSLDDIIVYIDLNRYLQGHFIFSSDGKFKMVKYQLMSMDI